mmetsp:Transcript_94231/g.236483  ORF Transcript_94231/g.236483 Transcript_94231/m.236483 type:complete len:517 (+) Transcript_94231:90-1640(+)
MGKKRTGSSGVSSNGCSMSADDDAFLDAAFKEAGAERRQAEELSNEGDECTSLGKWDIAVSQYTKAIKLDPNNGVHYCKRSFAHTAAGRLAAAIEDAKKGASLGNDNNQIAATCYAQLGFVYSKDGKLKEALEAFEKGLKLDIVNPGCRHGYDETQVALERENGGELAPPVKCADDLEAQKLMTLPSPEEVLGKGFEVVLLRIGTYEKPLRFLLSTTLSEEVVITPNTCGMLGLKIERTIELEDVSFDGGMHIGTLSDCTVSGFVQAQIADKALRTVIHGMLGLPFLERYDIDLDRVRSEQRIKEAGAAAKAASSGISRIGAIHSPGIALPGIIIGIPMFAKSSSKMVPLVGIIDTGSMFSVVNWAAAKQLGLAKGPKDSKLERATKVAGATKTGVVEMPLVNIQLNICHATGDIACKAAGLSKEEFDAKGTGNGWHLDFKNAGLQTCVDFGRVNAAIGDSIQFDLLRDSAVGDFTGPAALIGQDVLSQAPRLTLSVKDRQLWLDAPGRIIHTTAM